MLVAEFAVSNTILHSTLSAFADIELDHEAQYRTKDDGVRLLFWLSGVDVASFEVAIGDDPSVTEIRRLTTVDSTSLYRVDLTQFGRDRSTFPNWSEDDVVLLDAGATHDGWHLRMRFPDRTVLTDYREAYAAHDCPFFLLSLSTDTGPEGRMETALTSTQRDALVLAYESGYFDVPRRTSQQALASRLDISAQSVSERLRRATAALIESTTHRD